MGKVIEDTHPHRVPFVTRAYHSLTKDMIANEIFRRVEPKRRTMGEYFDEEIRPKFGGLDIFIKMGREQLEKCFDYKMIPMDK